MNRATSRALHRATCRDEFCGWCESRAEQIRADRDEPLSDGESAGLDNAYEMAAERMWER